MKLIDPDRVRVAASCAKEITNNLRLQLDVIKFARDLHGE